MRTLSVGEVAEILRTHPHVVYRLIRRGQLPAVHLGRAVRVSEDALRRFLAGEPVAGAGR